MKTIVLKATALAAAAIMLFVPPAAAQEEEEGIIKHRQAVMKAVGGHFGAMAAILKGKVKFTGDLKTHARAVADLAGIAARVFPEGSDFGDTRAKEEIWAKPKEFQKILDAFKTESAKLVKVADGGDVKAFGDQFKALGKNACGACHKAFREKKK
jgi:cytochrome c556